MNTEIRQRAKLLAEKIKTNLGNDLEISQDVATEGLHNIFTEEFEPIDYSWLMVSIMSLLTNPDISSRLEKYDRENAGAMLLKLVDFFNGMKHTDIFFDYLTLNSYCGIMTEDSLKWYEAKYGEKLEAVAA